MDRTAYRKAADALDEAYHAFVRDGDGSGDAFVAAYDYREAGYEIGEAVFSTPIPADEDNIPAFHEGLIDGECAAHPEHAWGLIWAAAEFRMAELAGEVQQARAA